MLNLLKKHRKAIIITIISVFVLCLLISHIPFWIGAWKVIIPTEMGESDLLSFLGSFISAIGTILLGWYAILQTDKANSTNDRLLVIEERRYLEEHQPAIIIENVILHSTTFTNTPLNRKYIEESNGNGRLYYVHGVFEKSCNEPRACIEIDILNSGRTGIYNCQVTNIASSPDELSYGIENVDAFWSAPFSLSIGNSLPLHLYLYPNVIERFATRKIDKIRLTLDCINDFNEKYSFMITIQGAIELHGNRYEDMLGPTPHPISWSIDWTQNSKC